MRRRSKNREINFSFDSFLDLVANVVGVILRFILVAWVGAKAYHSLPPALSTSSSPPAAESVAPSPEEDFSGTPPRRTIP